MKIKTNELTGAALDWAVAKCEGYTNLRIGVFSGVAVVDPPRVEYGAVALSDLSYSTDWAQGGPIIEREQITSIRRILQDGTPDWWATTEVSDLRTDYEPIGLSGPTPLIAAMRCYVVSKLGDEVEVPEELIKENQP